MKYRPDIGDWFIIVESDERFEVVAINDDGDSIDVQFFDGEITEYDRESWEQLDLKPCAPPEDWSGPFEIDPEELDDTEESMQPDYEDSPLDQLEYSEDETLLD